MENNTALIRFNNTNKELVQALERVDFVPIDTHTVNNISVLTDGETLITVSCDIDVDSSQYGETMVTMQDIAFEHNSRVIALCNNQEYHGDCGRMDMETIIAVLTEIANHRKRWSK